MYKSLELCKSSGTIVDYIDDDVGVEQQLEHLDTLAVLLDESGPRLSFAN